LLKKGRCRRETSYGLRKRTIAHWRRRGAPSAISFKVEQWSKDDQRVERLLHTGNRIDAGARSV